MSNTNFAWRRILLIAIVCIGAVGCGINLAPGVSGSGVSKTENRAVGDFASVTDNISADVDITVGPASDVVIEADDNLLPLITTEIHGGKLVISSKSSFSSRSPIKVTIKTPNFDGVEINGSGNAVIHGMRGESFRGKINGSGNITADGSVKTLDASIAGSGDLRLAGLAAGNARVSITGSGNASVAAADSLNASVTGSGNIQYKPAPALAVETHITGSGSVRPM